MGWTRTRRATASTALAGLVAVVPATLPPADAAPRTGTVAGAEAGTSAGARTGTSTSTRTAPSSGTVTAERLDSPTPRPPRLPRNFRGKGKWVVRDLGITVPFTWEGKDGNSQMIAGGPRYPIWFTNLIYKNTLYTLTYKWPNLNVHPCSKIPGFNLRTLNQALKKSRFVGRETLERTPQRRVNHWRVGVVLPKRPPGLFLRFPLALGDIYVDQRNRGTFWQVLQFGIQNLYDPELDEWAVMDTFEHKPGTVTLPARCSQPS